MKVGSVPIGAGRGMGYWGRFYLLLGISSVIATIGLWQDSGAVVIAAMLLAPLMEPILGIASTLVQSYLDRVVRLLVATLWAALVVAGLAVATMWLFRTPRGLGLPEQVLVRTDPGLGDLLVALAAGMAGAYVQVRRKDAGLLPGVAIGVSLVPPLAAAGILLYFSEPRLAWGALLLFLTNLAAIVLTASAVFVVLGMRPASEVRHGRVRTAMGLGLCALAVVVIASHLGVRTLLLLRESREEQRVLESIEAWAGEEPVEIRSVDVDGDEVTIDVVFAVPLHRAEDLVAPAALVDERLSFDGLVRKIRTELGREVDVVTKAQVRFVGEWARGSAPRSGNE